MGVRHEDKKRAGSISHGEESVEVPWDGGLRRTEQVRSSHQGAGEGAQARE